MTNPLRQEFLNRVEDYRCVSKCNVYRIPSDRLNEFIPRSNAPQPPKPWKQLRDDSETQLQPAKERKLKLVPTSQTPDLDPQQPKHRGAPIVETTMNQRTAERDRRHEQLKDLARAAAAAGERTSITRLCKAIGLKANYCSDYPALSQELKAILGDLASPRGQKTHKAIGEANAVRMIAQAHEWAANGTAGSAREFCRAAGDRLDREVAERRVRVLQVVERWVGQGYRKPIESLCFEAGLTAKWFYDQSKEFQAQVKGLLAPLPMEGVNTIARVDEFLMPGSGGKP